MLPRVFRQIMQHDIAGAPAAVALVVPEPADDRIRVLDQYDLGQATYAMILARRPPGRRYDSPPGAGHQHAPAGLDSAT
jgi:hypothetical protein